MKLLRSLLHRFNLHPRAALDSVLTYRRFLGTIKPELMASREAEIRARLASLNGCWQPARLQAPVGKRLVVIAPHPDDESIGCGGLLLAHRGKAVVHVVNLCDGRGGGRLIAQSNGHAGETDESKLVSARRAELAAAGRILGVASIGSLGFPDGFGELTAEAGDRLGQCVKRLKPDVVLLPWFLDGQHDHRVANILYAWGCGDLDCTVLGYEIWSLCQPNAVLDITEYLDEKLALVNIYQTQLATVDYASYVRGLAQSRAFLQSVRADRGGAAEGYFALPNRDYCDLVTSLYGPRGQLSAAGVSLL